MRLSCQQEDLHRGLSAVSRAIPARSTLPITQHVLVEANDSSITLSATDAETIAITYRIEADTVFGSIDATVFDTEGVATSRTYTSPGYDEAPTRLDIDMSVVFGSGRVR